MKFWSSFLENKKLYIWSYRVSFGDALSDVDDDDTEALMAELDQIKKESGGEAQEGMCSSLCFCETVSSHWSVFLSFYNDSSFT